MSIFDDLMGLIKGKQHVYGQKPQAPKSNFISPLPDPTPTPDFNAPLYRHKAPTPTPTPTPKIGTGQARNPLVPGWLASRGRALKPDEMMSGVGIASAQEGVPFDLLMDIAGLESQAGTWNRPFAPKNGPDIYADEKHARGPFMFLKGTAAGVGLSPNDRYSATESAIATAKKLKKGQLGEWDISDKPGAGGGRLTNWYTEDELEPYSFASLKRRSMLQQLAKNLGF